MKLHIVSFQVPYPPSYGGLVDVYYKLKALKEAGCHIILHTYKYRTEEATELNEIADEVYYYERYTGIGSLLSWLPYMVYSRRNRLLLERLQSDDSPILFEGLHTCYFLNHKSLRQRFKFVRTHNVEHDYYKHLGRSTVSWVKRCYYMSEAWKLRRYEKQLGYANALFAITPSDKDYFSKKYPSVPAFWLPCFFNDLQGEHTTGTDNYILYHGNLSVDENIKAALYILDNIVPCLDENIRVIIAGKSPVPALNHRIVSFRNVELIANPKEEVMDRLIARARINLLITFQSTGIKLKLIHALYKGHGHCLVNSPMLTDDALTPLCRVADEPQEFVNQIHNLYQAPPEEEEVNRRIEHLQTIYDNHANACELVSAMKSLMKT